MLRRSYGERDTPPRVVESHQKHRHTTYKDGFIFVWQRRAAVPHRAVSTALRRPRWWSRVLCAHHQPTVRRTLRQRGHRDARRARWRPLDAARFAQRPITCELFGRNQHRRKGFCAQPMAARKGRILASEPERSPVGPKTDGSR